jgi:hypothetical protein
MKRFWILGSLAMSFLMMACTSTETSEEKTASISGRWKLSGEEQTPNKEKAIDLEKQPTVVVMHLQQNGYFIIYDSFVDPDWQKKGLPKIQQRSKGQWIYENSELTLNNTGDSAFSKVFKVANLESDKLVIEETVNGKTIKKSYSK